MSETKNKSFSEITKEAWEHGRETGQRFTKDRIALRAITANRIRKCRLDARMTQEEISTKLDVNVLTYKGYENRRSDVPAVYLVRIADFYEVSVDYLLGRINDTEKCSSARLEERITQLEQMMAQLKEKKD